MMRLTWKPVTRYLTERVQHINRYVYTYNGKYYWMPPERKGEYAIIPYHWYMYLIGRMYLTSIVGPYKFYNGYQDTESAQYLVEMLKYKHLTARAQAKVDHILEDDKLFIEQDPVFWAILKARDCSK